MLFCIKHNDIVGIVLVKVEFLNYYTIIYQCSSKRKSVLFIFLLKVETLLIPIRKLPVFM